ncbi:MAG: winged helix-turn-helix domain-containing protein [Victivallaceae bacterium]
MELFTLLSKKEQIAEAIKAKVNTGKIAPGTKLNSVRELAGMFSVSTKIIVDAFDILESERFIRREAGKGVFVRGKFSGDVLDICLLGYRIMPKNDAYFSNLVRIAHPPFLHNGFSFIVRTIPWSEVCDDAHFEYELKKIEQHLNIDCLLISAPSLNKKQISNCLKLKMPVIFIGDFSAGLYPDMPFNQITGDNSWLGECCVRQLVERTGCRELTLYSGSLEHFFYRKAYEGALLAGNELDAQIHLIELPKGVSGFSAEKQAKCYRDHIGMAAEKGWLKFPGLNIGLLEDGIEDALSDFGSDQNVYHGESCEKSFERFFGAIYSRIEAVANNSSDYKKIRLKTDIKLELTRINQQ